LVGRLQEKRQGGLSHLGALPCLAMPVEGGNRSQPDASTHGIDIVHAVHTETFFKVSTTI